MAYANVQPRKLNPASLAAAIAINAAVFAALLTAAPAVEKVIPKAIEIFTPVEPEPPEPVPAEPRPQPRTDTAKPPVVDRIVETPTTPRTPIIELTRDPVITLDPPVAGTIDTGPIAPPAPVMTEAVIDPRYLRDFQPSYPPAKIRLEEEGRVTVRVLVGAEGRVLQVRPVGNPDADFFAATRKQALAKWRFKPATRDGAPIEAWREISVIFQLDG
ncbi:energy transducer TonB [Sphingomonas gilva]|uniref:Energy transducer TonB n=1 Tax=Sphingomonas gilva TaxID=2305907 RepID=A0A396RR46_9SPHN|nr:energy transducer TonB [Sphingomonas gilva]RHW17762.1 energy transducer TonB [Sphingomonas gilva]